MMKIEKKKPEETVKRYFAGQAEKEWRRLCRDPYHQIKFMLTMHFLKKYLPKQGLILDAGGGPGRYTIELARRGYDIVLLDLVPEMLKTAKKKAGQAGVLKKISQFVESSTLDLSAFPNEKFDAVLCLGGALNHLLKIEHREKAAGELVRVTEEGAPLFVSVIGRIGLLKTILIAFPHEMQYASHHWEIGDYTPGLQGEGFTATHWFLPEELVSLFEKKDVKVLEIAGLEGLSSHHKRETNRLYKDQEKWKMWTNILVNTCTHPSVVGSAEHFLLVARKKTRSVRH